MIETYSTSRSIAPRAAVSNFSVYSGTAASELRQLDAPALREISRINEATFPATRLDLLPCAHGWNQREAELWLAPIGQATIPGGLAIERLPGALAVDLRPRQFHFNTRPSHFRVRQFNFNTRPFDVGARQFLFNMRPIDLGAHLFHFNIRPIDLGAHQFHFGTVTEEPVAPARAVDLAMPAVAEPPTEEARAPSPAFEAFKDLVRWLEATDEEVATMAGVGRTTPYTWQRERREPRRATVRRLFQPHAAVAALVQRLGEAEARRWLVYDDPSRRERVLAGDLASVQQEIRPLLFTRTRARLRPGSWLPDPDTSEQSD